MEVYELFSVLFRFKIIFFLNVKIIKCFNLDEKIEEKCIWNKNRYIVVYYSYYIILIIYFDDFVLR